jgi:hypothetical protein
MANVKLISRLLLLAAGAFLALWVVIFAAWMSDPAGPRLPDTTPEVIAGLQRVSSSFDNTSTSEFGKASIQTLIRRLQAGELSPVSIQGAPLMAIAEPAWWYAQSGIITVIVVYIDSTSSRRTVRLLRNGAIAHDFEFTNPGGGVVTRNLVWVSFKFQIDHTGQVVDPSKLSYNKLTEPAENEPPAVTAKAVHGMHIAVVGASGQSADVPVMVRGIPASP